MSTLYSPRTTTAHAHKEFRQLEQELILGLDNHTMDRISLGMQGQTTLPKFVSIIENCFGEWKPLLPNRHTILQLISTNLFYNSTHDRSQTITWQQLTNYTIQKMTALRSTKPDVEYIPHISKPVRVPTFTNIKKMIYLPFLKATCFFEQLSNRVSFYDPVRNLAILKPLIVGLKKTQNSKTKKRNFHSKELPESNVVLLDILLIQSEQINVLLTSTSDKKVRGWTHGPNSFVKAFYPSNKEESIGYKFNSDVLIMCWDSVSEVVYCGFKNGGIGVWNISLNVVKYIQNDNTSLILCMASLPRLYMLATGGLGGKVTLWNIADGQKKWVYKHHSRGVLSLAYNDVGCQLFSAGFNHQICVWNPFVNQLIIKIQSHKAPIAALLFANNHLLSIDQTGIIKITNPSRFHTILTCETNLQELTGLTYMPAQRRLCLYGKNVSLAEYQSNYNPQLTDNSPTAFCYSKSPHELVTISHNRIKVWCLLTGRIIKAFETPLQRITSLCLFTDGVILGDIKGSVIFARINDELETTPLRSHPSEVTSIKKLRTSEQDPQRVVIGSSQIHLVFYVPIRFSVMKTRKLERSVVTSIQYQASTRVILVSTNAGTILVYTEALQLKEQINISTSAIDSIIWISVGTLIVSTGDSLWLIEHVQHTAPRKILTCQETITAMQVKGTLVFTGSQNGFLACYETGMDQIQLRYKVKTSNEAVLNVTCIEQHGVVVTTGADRMVKIWDVQEGKYIDQLRQNTQTNSSPANCKSSFTQQLLVKHNLKTKAPAQVRGNHNWKLHIDLNTLGDTQTQPDQSVPMEQVPPDIASKPRLDNPVFMRPPKSKERCRSTFSYNQGLKSKAQLRNVPESIFNRIQLEAKKSLQNQLKRIDKSRSLRASKKESSKGHNKENSACEQHYRDLPGSLYHRPSSIVFKVLLKANLSIDQKYQKGAKPIGGGLPKLL